MMPELKQDLLNELEGRIDKKLDGPLQDMATLRDALIPPTNARSEANEASSTPSTGIPDTDTSTPTVETIDLAGQTPPSVTNASCGHVVTTLPTTSCGRDVATTSTTIPDTRT